MPLNRLERMAMTAEEYRDHCRSSAKMSLERRVVKKLLYAITSADDDWFQKLKRLPAEREEIFTLAWMTEFVPTFPVKLIMCNDRIGESFFENWFNWTRRNNRLARFWAFVKDTFSEANANGQPIGFIVPAVLEGKEFVVHTASWSAGVEGDEPMIRRLANPYYQLAAEPLRSFVRRVSRNWRP